MGTLFASTLRALVREKSLFIWSLAFPILMATIFMFMFANLDESTAFEAVPTAVVADDGDMGVTQVVRGRDLLSSTPRQILLYRLLGYPEPEFGHTPLLVSSDGRRLSKRDGDTSLAGILGRGYSPRDVVGALACLAGLLPEPAPAAPEELLPLFAWEKLPREDIPLPPGLFGKG